MFSYLVVALVLVGAAIGWYKIAQLLKVSGQHRWPSTEELIRRYDEFKKRIPYKTIMIKERLAKQDFGGIEVAEVGDLCWWPDVSCDRVLIAVTLGNGKHIVVGYDDGVFSILSSDKGNYQMVLNNLQHLPVLELDDDCICIRFTRSRQLLVQYHLTDYQHWKRGWNAAGFGWSDSAACKKFAEHGMSFSAESGEE